MILLLSLMEVKVDTSVHEANQSKDFAGKTFSFVSEREVRTHFKREGCFSIDIPYFMNIS